MKIITISGCAKEVGKTTIALYLLKKLRDFSAIKISVHPTPKVQPPTNAYKDTELFKRCGAEPAILLNTTPENLRSSLLENLNLIPKKEGVLIESTRALLYIEPDIPIFVFKPGVEIKPYSFAAMKKAKVFVVNLESTKEFDEGEIRTFLQPKVKMIKLDSLKDNNGLNELFNEVRRLLYRKDEGKGIYSKM
jgi:hypothetical protein